MDERENIMDKQYVLYNPKANNGHGKEEADKLKDIITDSELIFIDITELPSYADFFAKLDGNENLIICGGDGTLNRFLNDTAQLEYKNSVYYYPTGSGNDFARDIPRSDSDKPFCIDEYIKKLPTVYINGMTKYFINGIGYGIDGYCCEVGDKLRAKATGKKINYAGIAVKGLLFHFKPRHATVTVDGETQEYGKVWIAPTMNGRCYGGGMIPTPSQDRLNSEGNLSLMLFQGSGKLKTLMIFPSIFKGEHVKYKKEIKIFEGKDITVRFDRPTALQIDGETVLGVTEYRALSGKYSEKEKQSKAQAAFA